MAESAPEGPLFDSPHEHGIIDSFLSAHGQDQSRQHGPSTVQAGPSHPQSAIDASAHSISQSAAGVTSPRPDTHLSLTEMLLLEEDSLAESKATPLLQHHVSMASNITDVFPLFPSSSASPMHSDRSMLGSPDQRRPADSASTGQQAESSGVGSGGWPGPAPEWISVVMRGKHGGKREAFIQYHVPEGLVYVNGTNLSLKVSCTTMVLCIASFLSVIGAAAASLQLSDPVKSSRLKSCALLFLAPLHLPIFPARRPRPVSCNYPLSVQGAEDLHHAADLNVRSCTHTSTQSALPSSQPCLNPP